MYNEEQLKKFDDYAVWTDSVAKYPPTAEPYYLALGIVDECGELSDSFGIHETIKESGDVMWYCARYSVNVLQIPFSQICNEAYELSQTDIMIDLGTIAGFEKKRIRDGELWTPGVKAFKEANARAALIRIISWVKYILTPHSDLLDAIYSNRIKLAKRLNEGTIRGDGDDR